MAFSDLGILLGDVTLAEVNHFTKDPMKAQEKVLKKILKRNKNCELGKKFNFANINSIADYQKMVPLSTYDDYDPYVERIIHNKEKNVMFTGVGTFVTVHHQVVLVNQRFFQRVLRTFGICSVSVSQLLLQHLHIILRNIRIRECLHRWVLSFLSLQDIHLKTRRKNV